jgi:hypothetical protein
MGRLFRWALIFLVLLLAGSLLALVFGVAQAGPVAAGAALVLLSWAASVLRGRRPGFTRAERQRIFGRWRG